jgi:protein TonB
MNEPLRLAGWPELDHPWQRLLWIVPLSLLLWMALLVGFSALVDYHRQSAPEKQRAPLQAQITYLPPAGGSPHAAAAPASPRPTVAHPLPAPHPQHPHRIHHRHVVERSPLAIPRPAAKTPPEQVPATHAAPGKAAAPAASAAHSGPKVPQGAAGGDDSGPGLKGIGGPSMGARATYAPLPDIPDDMREDIFEAVAVAHFQVDRDGKAVVTLSQPTSNPSLNDLLLATLKRWRFLPAVKDGTPVSSVFDIRIPIQVQ